MRTDMYLHLRMPGSVMSSTMRASHIIAILNICKRGDVVFLGKLLASNCDFYEVKDRKGRNALHYCAETDEADSSIQIKPGGRLACAALLLNSKFKLQDQADNEGFLPFHHAIIHGNIPLAKILLTHGVDVNSLVRAPSSDAVKEEEGNITIAGRSALHLAVIYAHFEMLDFLLSGSFEDDMEIIHKFSIDVNIQDAQSATALHYAVQLPEDISVSIIKCIIDKSDANINCTDAHGRSPLIWAATIGAALSTSILLKLGADPTKAEKSGLTALHCSASRGHASTVQMIIQHMDKLGLKEEDRKEILDAQDTDGCRPSFYSVTMGHLGVTEKLLAAGADPNATDNRGRSLFHCVSRAPANSVFQAVKLLLEYGANPGKVNAVGDTPLHEACSNLNKECVKGLLHLQAVADNFVNLKNSANQTPLQISTLKALEMREHEPSDSNKNALEICQLLVNAGANAETDEETGNSPHSLVRNCLRNAPNYRPAVELERIFNDNAANRKDSINPLGTNVRRESTATTIDGQEISEVSAMSFGRSTPVEEDVCKTGQGEKTELSSSSSFSSADGHKSYDNNPNAQTDVTTSFENVAGAVDEFLAQKENTSGHSCVTASSSKETPSRRSHRRSDSKVSSITESINSRTNSDVSSKIKHKSLIQDSKSISLSTSTPRNSRPCRQSSPTCGSSQKKSLEKDETTLHTIPSQKSSSPKCTEIPSTDSISEERSRRKSPSRASLTPLTPRKTVTPKPNATMATQICNGGFSRQSSLTPTLQTRKSSNRQTESSAAMEPSSVSSLMRSVPLKAQHLPAWTQTSFKASPSTNSRCSRLPRSSDRINELAKPRRRPRSSCDFPQKPSEVEGRQRLPQPTISPYLVPVARWPRTMASMLLMGEVSPLYCAQTLNVAGLIKPKKQLKKVPTERVRSAMEARVQLTLAEKDFVKLAAQVLDQYDALLIERQKLVRTRTNQQVEEKY